jgi:sigma-B regulation protein RsbU (phosphoserine phosphatase)
MRLLRVGDSSANPRTWIQQLDAVTLAAGDVLFRQDDQADALFFIEEGELAVMLEVPGAGRAPVRIFGPGQCLGEMALYRNERRTATVEALTTARLRKLTASGLAAMESSHPAQALAMHRHIAELLAERVTFSNVELKEPLARLAHALRVLAANDFADTGWDRTAVNVAAKRDDEVGAIAQAMEFLVKRLHTYIGQLRSATAAREAIESELRIAGQIQASLLPPPLTKDDLTHFDFAATIMPAKETGGDLFDGFRLPDGRFFMLVGDVSGKGVPAAVFMALTAMGVRTLARDVSDPGELLTQVSRLLCERNETLQFVTAFAAILDPATGELRWANAGHPSPALLDAEGRLSWLEGPRAVPLAAFENAAYLTQTSMMARGTTLVIYSDGVTEAMDEKHALFGDQQIASCFANAPVHQAQDTVSRLISAVKRHEAGATQSDDITVVALRRV